MIISDFAPAELISMGVKMRNILESEYEIVHPLDASINGLRHCLWTGSTLDKSSNGRGCVIAGEMIDRSPCGTGTSARLSQRAARGLIENGESFLHESYIGSKFTGTIEGQTKVGEYDAIVPGISGSAFVTGLNTIYVDSDGTFCRRFYDINLSRLYAKSPMVNFE